jgi:hypothetical protein
VQLLRTVSELDRRLRISVSPAQQSTLHHERVHGVGGDGRQRHGGPAAAEVEPAAGEVVVDGAAGHGAAVAGAGVLRTPTWVGMPAPQVHAARGAFRAMNVSSTFFEAVPPNTVQ